jgi:serine phosphatase RsbU (regulator of sigma subunit)/putative methionine-R-sulfoxide reductase with GAF domain
VDISLFLVSIGTFALIALGLILRQRRASRRALIQQVEELTHLADAGRAIAEARLDIDELCELIYRRASDMVDTSTFQIGLFDGDWYDIRLWIRDGQRVAPQRFDLHDNPGLIGWTRQSRTPLIVHDFEREVDQLPARPRYLSDHPPRSAVFVPLVVRDQVVGALSIQSYQPNTFADSHLRMLSIIGNQAAAAIANTHLLAQERWRATQIQLISNLTKQIAAILDLDTLFHQTVELVRTTFGYYFVAICVREEDSNRIIFEGATHPALHGKHTHVGQGIMGWVVENGEVLNVPDVSAEARYWPSAALAETRSELAVPLIFGGKTIGAIDIESDQLAAFDDEDIYILQTLADQIAIAIHEARLYAAEREQAWISTALLQVAEATGQASSLDEVLDAVVRITPMLSGIERCGIMLAAGEAGVFSAYAAYGIDEREEEFASLRLTPGDSVMLDEIHLTDKPIMRSANGLADPILSIFGPGDVLGLPLMAHGELSGVLWIGATPDQFLSRRKAALIGGIANQAAMAIESAQLAIAQREEAWVSTALLQVAEAVGSQTDLDEILSTVVRLTPLLIGVEVCLVFLCEAGQQSFAGGQAFGLSHAALHEFAALRISADEWPLCDAARSETLIRDVPDGLRQALELHAPLGLPLRARGDIVGALLVDRGADELLLSQRRLNILNGIAGQVAVAIENLRLMREVAVQQLLEKELNVAREIQKSFLPDCCPLVPGWQLSALWRSARRVGGDFYDFMELANGNLGMVIADVADKGVPAALFMALSRTLVRATAMGGRTPADALRRSNELILADARTDLFVTVFYGVLDPKAARFTYANAGHNPPIWLRARSGRAYYLDRHGIALGVVPEVNLQEDTVALSPGDVLALYTDGVTEAMNPHEEEFGVARLEHIIRENVDRSAGEIVNAIEHAVEAFVGGEPPFDDLTLVILKRDGGK